MRAAFAGDRDVLPALPVERPLAVPRGWTLLTVSGDRLPSTDRAVAELRYGVLPRVELNLAAGLRLAGSQLEPAETTLGARFQVLRTEPPNTSVAIDVAWHGGPGIDLLAARRFGPLLGTLTLGGDWRHRPRLRSSAVVLLQVGPLAPSGGLVATWPSGVTGVVGLGVQLSRGLAVRGELAPARSSLDLEIAF